ncbi:MAG: autotransporter-associated beta strand repeat-containing protein [Prevotella sp.]|nr:autotransporter-associated beta strand repeat-containing protein [Prevotella sp.]
MKKILLTALMTMSVLGLSAQRVTDRLDRGIVAVPANGGGYLVSWRMFGEEYYDTKYNLYRNGTKIASDLRVSNYVDAGGSSSAKYQVEAVVNGVAQPLSAEVRAWSTTYLDVPVKAVVNRAGATIGNSVAGNSGGNDTTTPGYTLNDVSLADVDGDGVCEFIVKRNNSQGNLRTASNRTDFNLYECYKIDGTRLWWIDLGPNLMAGADEQWDMIGYDWDEDGKAEVLMRGADNMIIHTATGKTINVGDMTAGFSSSDRPEYTGVCNEYLIYLNGETGEPYLGWDGSSSWTPMAYPLPQFEANETRGDANVWGDLGHRMQKHYFAAPYLDGRHPAIFLGRGCYTRHKACALSVDPQTHELTQLWRWNCYDSGSAWFGNGFHNFAVADVDMDGRDEIVYGSMILDDTGYGLATTGLGHGDAQHCGDLDPYRWGLEQFTCQEGSQGNSYWNATTGQLYYRKSDGGDDGRSLAGNFTDLIPGGQGRSVSSGVIGLSCDKVVYVSGDVMSGNYANLNNRIYWDGDLLDEIFNSKNGANRAGNIFKWGGSQIASFDGITNNWTKCNPSAQGDILGDWREELVLRMADNSRLRIYATPYSTEHAIYTLWHDHQYRNGMAWQCVGYNQPPHTSYFLGNVEGITQAPPPLILRGRTELENGATIATTGEHLLINGYADQQFTVQEGASPYILTINTPAWVQGSGSQQATKATPLSPARTIINYTTTLSGGAFSGATRLVKQGEGTLVLPDVVEKHTGPTDVWNGTLQFNGTFESSPLWLNRHTTLISNGGKFLGGLKADYNSTLLPGGEGTVGSVTASTLQLGFGSRVVFDIVSSGSTVAIDQLNATAITIDTKNWEYGPKYKTPIFEFRNGALLEAGRYQIGTAATIEGGIGNILVEGISGKRFELLHEDGKLLLLIEDFRNAATVLWNGTAANSVWDLAQTQNFLNGGQPDYAVGGDNIVFDDNAQSTNVVVRGAVAPGSITFNNNSKNYTLSGDSILGGGTITLNGTGKVTLKNENHTGATTVNGGTLEVNALANVTGITYGALGDVNQRITLNDGSTLAVTMPVITDQLVAANGNVAISVPTSMSLTFNKAIGGQNGIITKKGGGAFTLGPANNTVKQLIIQQGTVYTISANNVDQMPATVEFQGGTLWGANMEDTPGITNTANFVVPEGKTGTFYGAFRGVYKGTLTGAGTFNAYTGGVRCYWDGDWSQFTGTIVAGKENRQNKKSYDPVWAFRNTKGMPDATLRINSEVNVANEGNNLTIGCVQGTGTLTGSGTYTIGTNNSDISVTFGSSSPIIKEGTGTMFAYTPGLLTSTVTLNGGKLYFDASTGSLFGGALTANDGTEVMGEGTVSTITLNSGAMLTPRSPMMEETFGFGIFPGTIKASATLRFNQGSTYHVYVSDVTSYSALQPRFLIMNGTVKVTLLDEYQPKVGDEFTLWTASGSFSGTPLFDLPQLPDGLAWDTSAMAAKQGVLRIKEADTEGISRTAATDARCEVFTPSGVRVAVLNATRTALSEKMRQAGLPAGTYIVTIATGSSSETTKVVVR